VKNQERRHLAQESIQQAAVVQQTKKDWVDF
jgi:hypothetical protein